MNNKSFANEKITNLIIPVSYFVNHIKPLNDLKNNLSKYRQGSVIGTSGIGKTQFARTYAYENMNRYNLIWSIDCNVDINTEFVKLAKKINQINKTSISEDIMTSKREVIEYLTNKDKWLLIFDNLKIGDNKKVTDIIEWEHNGNILFCSQDATNLPNIIKIEKFNTEDSITLSENLLVDKDKKNIKFLAEAFDGYPILIVQGAQLLNQVKGLNKEEYRKKVYQSADKIRLNIELAIKELKPSAVKLLRKVALINNQGFSKELLNVITDNKASISEDLYQLSKFMLISNIDNDGNNPIFEIHDVIAAKITEINGDKENKNYLEDIILRLVDAVPKSVLKGRIFRSSKTMLENFEIICRHAEKYNVNIYRIMELNSNLTIQYANSLDFYNIEAKINWFNKNDQNGKFKLLLMNNDQKARYGAYLGIIGSYYRHRYADYNKAIEYFVRSTTVFDNVKGYEFYKLNIICQLALIHIGLGEVQESSQSVHKMEKMLNSGLVDKEDITFAHFVKTKLLVIQGQYLEALEQINKTLEISIKNGLNPNDLFLTSFYLLKAETLNTLGKYQEAYIQVEQIYNMHKLIKKEDHYIYGKIYMQMAKSELGLGKIENAFEHIKKAIAIFLADERRNSKEADYSENPDLASSYVVQGDIFFVQDKLKQAIESYKKAQVIYFYLYRDRSKNINHVSYLYMQGAKAACKAKDLYNYKSFAHTLVKSFGYDHHNTIEMFNYCKQYNMDLWSKEN